MNCLGYITKSFAEKGLGEFRYGVRSGPGDTVATKVIFLDPKDQFKYELLGGERWRWQLMQQWSVDNDGVGN